MILKPLQVGDHGWKISSRSSDLSNANHKDAHRTFSTLSAEGCAGGRLRLREMHFLNLANIGSATPYPPPHPHVISPTAYKWNKLDQSVMRSLITAPLTYTQSQHTQFGGGGTDGGVDLPILCRHAVTMLQVGEWLGCPPRLQVAGHPHWRPHLGTIWRGPEPAVELRAVPLCLQGATEHGSRLRSTPARTKCWICFD